MGNTLPRAVAVGLLALFTVPASAQNNDIPSLVMTYSFDSLSGKFGTANETTAKAATLGATLVGKDYRASVFVPYLQIEGPGTVVAGTVTGGGARRKSSGLGDIVATYSQDVVGGINQTGFNVALTGLVKIASGDEREGLGTGKTDYGIQAELAQRFDNKVALTATVGRTDYGRTSALPLINGNHLILGASLPLFRDLQLNLSTSRRDPLVAGAKKREENSISGVFEVNRKSALQFGFTKGKSTASPDDIYSLSYIHQVD